MSFSADELEEGARAATGLDDFGSSYYREGLERTVDGLNDEADLNELGNVIQHATISNALIQRLKIIDTYKQHPEIADEVVDGPVVILGLPRTGTTALGNWWPTTRSSGRCEPGSRRHRHRHRRPPPSTPIRGSRRPPRASR